MSSRFKILLAEKEARDRRNWSYIEIQALTGVGTHTLSGYAQNIVQRFDAVTLDALCKFVECQVGDLLTRVPAT